MRVAIVHPWFLALGGAEQTVIAMAEMFPEATIFTIFSDATSLPKELDGRDIRASWWNFLPFKFKYYRQFLPLYVMAFESIDLRGYDLIISSDSTVAKAIITDQNAVHICYCHSPMRCLYDQYREFRSEMPWFARPFFALSCHYLRAMDFVAAQRVTVMVSISLNVAQRIECYYKRKSYLIHPPVNTDMGYIDPELGDYYLTVGRLTRPKRVDLLIEACNKLGRRLVVVGAGRDLGRLKSIAGPTIEFVGRISDPELVKLYARCRAFLFAADEDFGIVPVEAQSYGKPIIAFGHGGALETVRDGVTGIFFERQTVDSLIDALNRFENNSDQFDAHVIKHFAAEFDVSVFKRELRKLIDLTYCAKKQAPECSLDSAIISSQDGHGLSVSPRNSSQGESV
jgi:glycosyltransferase involved in cell wall biosynthesis